MSRLQDTHEQVNHPPHYTQLDVECIDVIAGLALGYHEGCAMKYLWRVRHKDDLLTNLKKARWYLDRKIQTLEEEADAGNGDL